MRRAGLPDGRQADHARGTFLAALIVTTSIVLDQFPEVTSDLLVRIIDGGVQGAVGYDMKDMSGKGTC